LGLAGLRSARWDRGPARPVAVIADEAITFCRGVQRVFDAGQLDCAGYTTTVRPPVNVTDKIKRDQMAAYGLAGQRLADYELDHLLSRAVAV
jgi:hypothetical protein